MTRGKFVLVPLPFDDLSSAKVRPALCLTEPIGANRHVILAFLTSRIDSELSATDIVLEPSALGFADTGLRVASTLKLHRVVTLTTSLIRRELDVLSPSLQKQVNDRLRSLFGL
jgi:mRNA interferase MazF